MDFYEFDRYCLLELTNSEFKVYKALMLYRHIDSSECFPSQRTLAADANLSLTTVNKCIKRLKEKSFLLITKMKRRMGHYNLYHLLKFPTFTNKKEKASKPSNQANNSFDDIEYIPNTNEDTYDSDNIKENKKDCCKIIKSKTELELTEWQTFISKKHLDNKRFVLRACKLFNKKKGKSFSFLLDLYKDILFEHKQLTTEFLLDIKQDCNLHLANFKST